MGLVIGKEKIEYGLMLAPMAGYTDRAMRLVCREAGAEWSVTEMVSAKAVTYGDKKTHTLARIGEGEGRVSLQIFGSEPHTLARAADELQAGYGKAGYMSPCAIDINMGCPVNKIYSNGEGSALMKNPELIFRIVRAVSESIDIPVTVKLRAGIDSQSINAVECALAAEAGGAAAIAIHGRTRVQMYGGKSDLEIIKAVKGVLKIPVIGNGDITDAEGALKMLEYTGCDGIMIGRGAVGNPFIFAEILARLKGEAAPDVTVDKRREVALRQLRLAVEDKGEKVAIPEARRQIAAYFKGFSNSARLRCKINTSTTEAEVIEAIMEVSVSECDI